MWHLAIYWGGITTHDFNMEIFDNWLSIGEVKFLVELLIAFDVEDIKTTGNQTKKLELLPQNKSRTQSRVGK